MAFITGNDAQVAENQGLSNCEYAKALENSHIVTHYKFKGEITHRTATMDFANRYNSAAAGLDFREEFLVYLRDICRVLGNEGVKHRWGNAEAYDHTRRPTKGKGYNDKGKNAHIGTYRM